MKLKGVTLMLFINSLMLFGLIVLLAFSLKSASNENDKYKESIKILTEENSKIKSKLSKYNTNISNYSNEINNLKIENKKLSILASLNECPMCGRKDEIEIYNTSTTTTVSCNHCYTKVDFDEPIETVLESKVKNIWNGLKISPIK